MPYSAYPADTDLREYLRSLRLFDADEEDAVFGALRLDQRIREAVAEWERATGYQPFLAAGAATERPFDPPGPPSSAGLTRGGGRVLDLAAGLATFTSLVVGVTATTPAGTALTRNTDFWLYPLDAEAEGRPWDRVEFASLQTGAPNSVRITGRWGWSTTVPDDAWGAILVGGALRCANQIGLAVSGGTYSVRTLNTETRFGGGGTMPLSVEKTEWQRQWREAVSRYRRITM